MKKKKLNVALAVLSASFLAMGLAACKGGEESGGSNESTITSIRNGAQKTIVLTDAATEADFQAELDKLTLQRVNYSGAGASSSLKGSDCDVVFGENIRYGHIGTYSIVLKPKAEITLPAGDVVKNPNGIYTRVEVAIQHDWQGDDHEKECKVCHATLTTEALGEGKEETLTFKGFHDGENELSGQTIVQPYGTAVVAGKTIDVATFTVGRLTKGTSITVNTIAKADAEGETWYFPIIGIADIDAGEEYTGGYGTSVFIRNEGWTLINGVGSPRMLAALAGGSVDSYNYGSRVEDTTDLDKRPSGYNDWKNNSKYASYTDLRDGLPMTAEDYLEWAAYSTGDQLYTSDYSSKEEGFIGVETNLTWTYRDDGIIELTIANPGMGKMLLSRIRVPDNDKGYYDTLIHGECMTYTINGASYVTPMTLEDITATANKEKSYLANTKLNFADITVSAKYQQDENRHTETTGYDVYGFIPGAGTDKVGDATGTFYNLSNYTLVPEMTQFKVVLTVGPYSAETIIAENDFVKVVPNSVNLALSTPLTIDGLTYSSTISGYTMELSGTADAKLTLRGVASTFTAAQKEKLGTEASKYVAVRLYSNELGAKFTNTDVSGATAYFYGADGTYVDLVIALEAGKTSYEITGLQAGKIILDLTNIEGTAINSAFTAGSLYFNKEGTFTAVYKFEKNTLPDNAVFEFTRAGVTADDFLGKGISGVGITVTEILDQNDVSIDDTYAGSFSDITELKVTFKKEATSLATVAFCDYKIAIREGSGGKILVQDTVKVEKIFSNDNASGVILDGEKATLLAEVSNGKLYIAKILSDKTNITSSDLTVNSLTLNFNAGKKDKVALVKLEGSYTSDGFVTNDGSLMKEDKEEGVTPTVKTTVYFDGQPDYLYDNDYIAVVRYEIDLSKIEDSTNFDLASDSNGYYYTIGANNALTATAVGDVKEEFLTENRGDCYDGALAAKPVGGTAESPAFYAAARYIGGNHVDKNNDKVCDLCGANFAEHFDKFGPNMWDNKYGSGTLAVGDVVDIWGTFEPGTNPTGRMTVALQEFGETAGIGYTIYGMDGSGWGNHTLNEWGGETRAPYHKPEGADVPTSGSEDFTRWKTPLPMNTLIGTEANDGSGTITDEAFAAVLNNGATTRTTVILTAELLTVRFRLYRTADMTKTPYADYTFTLEVPQGCTYAFDYTGVWGGGGTGSFDKNGVTVVRDKLTHNVLSSVEAAEGNGYTATVDGTKATISGMADKNVSGDYTHSIDLKLNFSQALVASTRATVVGIEGATATLDNTGKVLTVHLPLTKEAAKTYTIHLENDEASTLQSDITLDITNVAITNYEVAETENTLTLTGGNLTLTFSGEEGLTNDMKLSVNGVVKPLTEVVADAEFGTLKVVSKEGNVITFTQTALDFTKKIENYNIQLLSSADQLLVFRTVQIQSAVSGANVVDDQVLVLAEGSKVTFVLTQGVGEGQTKAFAINANMGGAIANVNKELLKKYDLSVRIKDGVVYFTTANLLTRSSTLIYSALNGNAVTITVDLSALGIVKGDAEGATDPAYGLQVLVGEANALYTVASDRTLAAITPATGAEAQTIQAGTCEVNGISAKAHMSGETVAFWYDVEVTEGHHTFTAEGGECSVCHEATGWTVENVTVGAADFSTAESITEHGEGKAYYPTGLATNSVILRGQTVTFEGRLTQGTAGYANMTGVSALFSKVAETTPLFFRTDNWIDNATSQEADTTREIKLAKAIKMNGSANVDYGRMKNIRDNSEATISFAWIKGEDPVEASEGVEAKPGTADKIVITMTFEGIDTQGVQVSTYTITPAEGLRFKDSKYAFGLTPVKGSFTGSVTAVADKDDVPAAECNPSKHTHVYDETTGRCPVDGELNPAHTHNYVGGVCVCGNADLAVLDTLATKVETFTNSDTNEAWWNGITDSVTLTGNYVLKATYKNASKAFPEAVAEVNVPGTDPIQCLDVRMDNATNPKDIWGLLYEGAVKQVVTTGTQPTEGNWKGDFTVYTWRKGDTFGLVMSFTPEGASEASYSLSITGTGFTTAENVAFLFVGNPYGLTDFVVKTGAIPAQTPSTTVE